MTPSLNAPRRGYRYQDLVSALLLARSVLGDPGVTVALDRPIRRGDLFDDIDIFSGVSRFRRQVKHSDQNARALEIADFTTSRTRIRFKDLVRSALADTCFPAAEYSLIMPWPVAEPLRALLLPGPPDNVLRMATWRFDPNRLWPEDAEPIWRDLRGLARADVLAFAARFRIEVAPAASLDLDTPGPLELALFASLQDDIGVGVYPNADRRVTDVAAALIDIASTVRVNGESIRPDEVVRRLALRTDYGRIAQQFPIVRDALVARTSLIQDLADAVLANDGTRLIGPPGSGKSWLLTAVAELLAARDILVARHYCYLEPGDEEVQRRVMTRALFANLIAELVDGDPTLLDEAKPRFGSGARELEALLVAASTRDPNRPIVLLIDGLDHVARVVETASTIARDDTGIVEELALLTLPPSVHLVVASQPGSHLDPLLDRTMHFPVPAWSEGEIALLAVNLRLPQVLKEEGGLDDEQYEEARKDLTLRADGNPLYATYLCRTLAQRHLKEVSTPKEILAEAPAIAGDISRYYASLLPPAALIARLVAEALAFVEFGMTEEDLRAVYPAHAPYVADAIQRLKPVLRTVSSQGGIRLYHESFRRFVVETAPGGASAAAARILPPVVNWLDTAGFFESSRAYRFLLPLLARSGRQEDVIARISSNFVEHSILHGHAAQAIHANLLIAANAAMELDDWPAYVRIVELERARGTAESLFDQGALLVRFARAFIALYGASALTERLIFDGKPTFGRDSGLVVASLCEDAGASPPWREYLALRSASKETSTGPDRIPEEAEFHGYLTLNRAGAIDDLIDWLSCGGGESNVDHALALVRRAASMAGPRLLLDNASLVSRPRAILRIGVATALVERGDHEGAMRALAGVDASDVPAVLLERFGHLANRDAEAFAVAFSIDDLARVCSDGSRLEATATAEWVVATRLAARVAPDRVWALRRTLMGTGWTQEWLRFQLGVARAEAIADTAERDAALILALTALRDAGETPHPFSIFSAASTIHDTFRRALTALESDSAFATAVDLLVVISRTTASSFQGDSMGALVTEAFIDLVTPFASTPARVGVVKGALLERVGTAESRGEFYETHALHDLQLAHFFSTIGSATEAAERWSRAARYLTAYGFRKDMTAFEPIESLETLAASCESEVRVRLVRSQALAENVHDHTDGKETKWIYHKWFDALRVADPCGAIDLLARSTALDGGRLDWRLEDMFEAVADQLAALPVRPRLAAFIQASTRAKGTGESALARTAVLRQLLNSGDERDLVSVLAGAITGEAATIEDAAISAIGDLARDFDVDLPPIEPRREDGGAVAPRTAGFSSVHLPSDALPHSARDLLLAFHRRRFAIRDDPAAPEAYENALGYRLLALGDDAAIIRLLRAFVRAAYYDGAADVLEGIAEGFAWRGNVVVAASAYALSYAYARSSWRVFGSREARWRFLTAVRVDRDAAFSVLRAEAKYFFEVYDGSYGPTQHCIELFDALGDSGRALAMWDAAVEVIERRLPLATAGYRPFLRYDGLDRLSFSLDEAAARLLLSRVTHADHHRKRSALAGVAAAVQAQEPAIVPALATALTTESGATTKLALLAILNALEDDALWCVRSLTGALRLLAGESLFGIQRLSSALLDRVHDDGEWSVAPSIVRSPRALDPTAVRVLTSADPRIELLEEVTPGFASMFAQALDKALADEERQQKGRYRSSSLYDLANRRFPEHFLYEHAEVVEETLHHVAAAIGPDATAHQREVTAGILVPPVERYVAHWHSRVPRPADLRRPSAHVPGRRAPTELADPGLEGWYRIGYYERELTRRNAPHPPGRSSPCSACNSTKESPPRWNTAL